MSKQLVVTGLIAIVASVVALQVSPTLALLVLALFAIGILRSHLRRSDTSRSTTPSPELALAPTSGQSQDPEDQEESLSSSAVKRPFWLWVICLWYIVAVLLTVLTFYWYWNGTVPITPAIKSYLKSITLLEVSVALLIAGIKLVAAALLFTLRRQCVLLFGILLVFNVLNIAWGAATRRTWFALMSNVRGVVYLVVGVTLSLAIFLYTRHLKQIGLLT